MKNKSNFVLGCVLNFKHKIDYIGMYYVADPQNMQNFGEGKIVFVDPSDNVGLESGGVRHTLVAIRQFASSLIPMRLEGRPKNCEPPHSVDKIEINDSLTKKYCVGEGKDMFCRAVQFVSPKNDNFGSQPIFLRNHVFYISANGKIFIQKDFFEQACKTWTSDPLSEFAVIYESCRL